MAVTTGSVVEAFRQLTAPQKRDALYAFAQELMDDSDESLPITDPNDRESVRYLISKLLPFPIGPGKMVPLADEDPEIQRRVKMILAGAKTISFEEVIRDWLKPDEADRAEEYLPR